MEVFMMSYEEETVTRPRPRVYNNDHYPQSGHVYVYCPREGVIDSNQAAEMYGGFMYCERITEKTPMSSSSNGGSQGCPIWVNHVAEPSSPNPVSFALNQEVKPTLSQPRSYFVPTKTQELSQTNPVRVGVNQDAKPTLMQQRSYGIPTKNQEPSSANPVSFGVNQDAKPTLMQQGPYPKNQKPSSANPVSFGVNQDAKPTLMQQGPYPKNQKPSSANPVSFGVNQDAKPPLMQQGPYPKNQDPSSPNPVNFVVNQDPRPQLIRVNAYLVPAQNQESVSQLNKSYGNVDETAKRNTTNNPPMSNSSRVGLQVPPMVNKAAKPSSTTSVVNQGTKPSLMQLPSNLVPSKNQNSDSHLNNSYFPNDDVNKRACKYISSVKERLSMETNPFE